MTSTVEASGGNGGNTKNPITSHKHWFLTVWHKTVEECRKLLSRRKCKYQWGEHIGEKSGKYHIHLCIHFNSSMKFDRLKQLFPQAHIEWLKGDDKANKVYLEKNGKWGANYDIKPYNNVEEYREWLKLEVLKLEYNNLIWKDWQEYIIKLINGPIHPRQIYWIYESKGNVGKTFCAKYIACINNVIVCEGKKNDIFNQVNNAINRMNMSKLVICDCPRTSKDYLNYGAIEQLKNGMLYSGKYEGGVCIFPRPQVICFANFKPEYDSMSMDRWVVKKIKNNKLIDVDIEADYQDI